MLALGKLLALLLALAATAGAALIVCPAPSKTLALVAILASEKSAFIVGAAALALLLAAFDLASKIGMTVVVLGFAALVVGVAPLVQAHDLASNRGVSLDAIRYLLAPIDTEGPGKPNLTMPYAVVDGDRTLSVDVYLPAQRPTKPGRPLVVVHGGFWSAGERGEASLASRRLAELGFTVFDVDYRLAPQPNWKTATGDVKCAIGWVKSHPTTSSWNIDPKKLAVLGRSAGGHLALMAGYAPADPELPPSCATGDTSVDAVVALYAPTDLAWGYAHPSNPRVADSPAKLRAFLDGPPESQPARYQALSPASRVTAGAPRTLLAHGGRDQFVGAEQMSFLATRLSAAGVAHDALYIPYGQHAFDFVPGSFSSQILEAALLRFLGDPRD